MKRSGENEFEFHSIAPLRMARKVPKAAAPRQAPIPISSARPTSLMFIVVYPERMKAALKAAMMSNTTPTDATFSTHSGMTDLMCLGAAPVTRLPA